MLNKFEIDVVVKIFLREKQYTKKHTFGRQESREQMSTGGREKELARNDKIGFICSLVVKVTSG